jgi:GTP cyclohydrolase IIa
MIQLALFQLDNYGPWTVTPAPRREMDLQSLQSRLYADVASFVGARGGYAFYVRGDNMIATTNRFDRTAYESLQQSIRNKYPVTMSVGIGTGSTPRDALGGASKRLQSAGSAQSATRTEALCGTPISTDTSGPIQVAHFDIEDATGRYTDRIAAFDAYCAITQGYGNLMRHLYRTCDSLAFFVGGDNVIGICPQLDTSVYRAAIDYSRETSSIDWKVGVGQGSTAQEAGMEAKHALETCRDDEQTVAHA